MNRKFYVLNDDFFLKEDEQWQLVECDFEGLTARSIPEDCLPEDIDDAVEISEKEADAFRFASEHIQRIVVKTEISDRYGSEKEQSELVIHRSGEVIKEVSGNPGKEDGVFSEYHRMDEVVHILDTVYRQVHSLNEFIPGSDDISAEIRLFYPYKSVAILKGSLSHAEGDPYETLMSLDMRDTYVSKLPF